METLEDGLDSLLASAASPGTTKRGPGAGQPVADFDIDDLLSPSLPPPPPPQRYSGGATPSTRATSGWSEPSQQSPYGGQSYGQEFGAARGAFGNDPEAAHKKAVKGDRLVTNVEVSDDGACPVSEKDIDPKTVAALKARGIETFTPVQVTCFYEYSGHVSHVLVKVLY